MDNISLSEILFHLKNLTKEERKLLWNEMGFKGINGLLNVNASVSTYESVRQYSLLILPPVIFLLGFIGNILSLVILMHRWLRKFSTYVYLSVLNFADTLVLLVGLVPLWYGYVTQTNLRNSSSLLCKLGNLIGYTTSDWSVWLLVAVTAERCIAVCFPYKASRFCTRSTAVKLIVCFFVLLLGLNFHFLWTVDIEDGVCQGIKDNLYLIHRIWPWIDLALYSTVPFLLICLCNCFIVAQVWHTRRRTNTLFELTHHPQHGAQSPGSSSLNKVTISQDNLTSFSLLTSGNDVAGKKLHTQVTVSESPKISGQPRHDYGARLTVMLLSISGFFLVCTLPMSVYGIYVNAVLAAGSVTSEQQHNLEAGRVYVEMLMYIHHSANFYLYCATGTKFRRQFVDTFLCGRKRRKRQCLRAAKPPTAHVPRAPRWGAVTKARDANEYVFCKVGSNSNLAMEPMVNKFKHDTKYKSC